MFEKRRKVQSIITILDDDKIECAMCHVILSKKKHQFEYLTFLEKDYYKTISPGCVANIETYNAHRGYRINAKQPMHICNDCQSDLNNLTHTVKGQFNRMRLKRIFRSRDELRFWIHDVWRIISLQVKLWMRRWILPRRKYKS